MNGAGRPTGVQENGMEDVPSGGQAPGATTEIVLPPAADGGPGEGGVRGSVRIAPAVLIELIELTVRDVPGVAGIHRRRRGERILPRGGHAAGRERRRAENAFEAGGVRVRVAGDQIDADVSIVIEPDADIRALSEAIQRKVGIAAGRMLGMTVTDVNIYVADVDAGGAPGGRG